jgi:hypothetical protein
MRTLASRNDDVALDGVVTSPTAVCFSRAFVAPRRLSRYHSAWRLLGVRLTGIDSGLLVRNEIQSSAYLKVYGSPQRKTSGPLDSRMVLCLAKCQQRTSYTDRDLMI